MLHNFSDGKNLEAGAAGICMRNSTQQNYSHSVNILVAG